MVKEFVQLVNEQNIATGIMEKMEAHKKGFLHRAVSVLIFNSNKELLLQQRAPGKYHSAGLWTNTCCTHPLPSEDTRLAAERRLQEEMGIRTPLVHQFDLLYRAAVGNSLVEYEYDEVFFGYADNIPVPNKEEVSSWIYLSLNEIDVWLAQASDNFTAWFPLVYEQAKVWL